MENNFQILLGHLKKNDFLWEVINSSDDLNLPNWYVGAGCIAQTVWNNLSNRQSLDGIKDIDWVYFDQNDLSEDAEAKASQRVREKFSHIPVKFDVKNQARIHTWYKQKFGYGVEPYSSIEAAIDTYGRLLQRQSL